MLTRFIVFEALVLFTECTNTLPHSLVGHYAPLTLYLMPCDYDLSLHEDGSYQLHGTVNKPGGAGDGGSLQGFEDTGNWRVESATVILTSDVTRKVLRLSVSTKDGVISLDDGEMFGLKVKKEVPNQSAHPPLALRQRG